MNMPKLLSPLTIRGVTLRNRVVISPMCTYSAKDGLTNDWHFAHLAKFAMGGASLIFTEAAAVVPNGRITHGDLGIWSDEHVAPLRRITDFLKAYGAVPAIQLAHAGRKASMQRPWHGNGPLEQSDKARGENVWPIVAPSPLPMDAGWLLPHELTETEIHDLHKAWAQAARRSQQAGFEVIELHSAHGYLGHEFLSPVANKRTDRYGGSLENRMRFTLELVEQVRAAWPEDKPLFVRLSSVDGVDGGWVLEDSVALARELKKRGVDVIDCSSGGLLGSATAAKVKRRPGFQVPYAEAIRKQADMLTMTVGLILDPKFAEDVLQAGQADLIAIGREALYNPNWAVHAARSLGVESEFSFLPEQYGWWLDRRQKQLDLSLEAPAAKAG
jgi:2,4-dienoyl-CoA reductase-like NADH-dependent reductase (Old Yellow Enzyme family)